MFLRLLVTLALVGLSGRLVWLQVVTAAEITRRAEELRLVKLDLTPVRGAIRDRHNMTIAVSSSVYTAVANMLQIKDPAAFAAKVAPPLGLAPDAVLVKLQGSPRSGHIPLKSELSQDQKRAVENLRLEGVYFEQKARRDYPQGATANQVIGYVDATATKGEYGLEAFYEKELRGVPGFVWSEVTPGNTPIEGTIKESVPTKPGLDLVLTLDVGLQQLAEQKLDEVVKETKAKRAMVIAMDVHNGEILVMAMRPGADSGDRKTWLKPDGTVDFARINNWAVTPMPVGSIFKTVTSAIALEERAITLDTTFFDKGYTLIDGWTIRNWDSYLPPTPKPMTIADLLQRSSNVGLIQVGQKIPRDTYVKYLKSFGFMEPTGLDVTAEGTAIGAEGFDRKSDVDWANMYIGQHLEVTPIQMITAGAAVANGGYLVQPHLVRAVLDPNGTVVRTTPTDKRRQVISQQTSKEMRDLLISVVEKGTAATAVTDGYRVGGKTGTAQKFVNGHMKDRYLADFLGFAPAGNPRVEMLVMVDEPEGSGYGGVVAAPIFSALIPRIMQSLNIPPDAGKVRNTGGARPAVRPISSVVPNAVGLPPAWARQRLESAGFAFKLTGTGPVVTSQSLQPGATAAATSVIELRLAPADPKRTDQVTVPDFTGLSLKEAGQVADEVGLTASTSGSGFVIDQDLKVGAAVPLRSSLNLRMAPPVP